MAEYKVCEKFASINGEGRRAGQTAVFIRFAGCNLRCSYCDTMWANDHDAPHTVMNENEILDYIASTGIKNVTLTGGEPLLRDNIGLLIDRLGAEGYNVEIETNGSVNIEAFARLDNRPSFTLDYKLPSSGMESRMLTENYAFLQSTDTVKFVCGSDEDLNKAYDIINEYGLSDKCAVYLSPVFGKIEPADMVDFMIKHRMNGVNLQLQLHKFIWDPDKRGV